MRKFYKLKNQSFTTGVAILLGMGVFALTDVKAQKTYNRVDSTSISGGILNNVRAQKMIFGSIDAVNNGKDQDLLIFKVGNETTSAALTFTGIELYKNNGTGTYTLNASAFDALKRGNGAWSKTDGNIVTNGLNSSDVKTTMLYARDGSGNYVKVVNPVNGTSEFPGTTGFVGFIDYNGDGKDDIFLVDNDTGASFLYQNLGSNQYTLLVNPVDGTSNFPVMILNSYQVTGVVVGDYNKDGKQDIAVAAKIGTGANDTYTSIYKNNGNGTFSKVSITLDGTPNANFTGMGNGSIDFGDLDGDGFATDIAVQGNTSGNTNTTSRMIKVYKQDPSNPDVYTTVLTYGNGSTGQTNHQGGKRYGQVIFGDLTGSGFKKDLITTGQTATGYVTTEVLICKGAPYTDFTVYSRYGNNPSVYTINTTAFGSFIWDYASNSNYRFFAFGDIDGDGRKDDVAKFGIPANAGSASIAALYTYNDTPLPVNFISFAAKSTTSGVQLSWKVASETDHKQYIVSRSSNGTDFTLVAKTTGYSLVDKNAIAGTYYYKLEQEDLDGKINHLDTKVVKVGLNDNKLSVYPNPTKGTATVALATGAYTGYTVVGVQGNTVASGKIGSADHTIDINLASVAAGTYIIKLTGASGNIATRVIKL